MLIYLINQGLEKVKGVLLLPNVDRLTPEFEHLPEAFRFMVLKLAFQ